MDAAGEGRPGSDDRRRGRAMTRDELIAGTRQLIDEGDRLIATPSLPSLQIWLKRSDDLLATAWGSMDRYHLAWLMVGKPTAIVRGRPMTADEEAGYVRGGGSRQTAAARAGQDEPGRGGAARDAGPGRDRRDRAGRGCRGGPSIAGPASGSKWTPGRS